MRNRLLALLLLALSVPLALWACREPSSPTPGLFGAAPIPTTQAVAAWYVDEVNGSDSNNGQTAGKPIKTLSQLQTAYWGCAGGACPRLRQNTVINFANAGDTTCLDPAIFQPSLEAGHFLALVGTPYGCTTDTLRLVAAGGSATRTGLQAATLNALDAGSTAMFLQTTTVDSGIASLGWGVAPAGGGTGAVWMWTQPLYRTTYPPVLNTPPLEANNIWANSDPVTYCSLPAFCPSKMAPIVEHAGAGSTAGAMYVVNMKIVSEAPVADSGAAIAPLNLNGNVHIFESYVGRPVFVSGADDGPAPQYFWNDYFASNVQVQGNAQQTWIVGGTVVGNVQGANVLLDGDMYLQGTNNVLTNGYGNVSQLATAGMPDSGVLNIAGTTLAKANAYDAGVIWANQGGPILNVQAGGTLLYNKTSGAAYVENNTFPGLVQELDSQTKACLSYAANAATTAVCNLTYNGAAFETNLDDGGHIGCLYAGGKVCNYAQ